MACKTLKIGVFFDGTGNNETFDASDGRDQQSNVAKLHLLYRTGDFIREDKTEVTAESIYIKGIGTYDTQKEYDAHPIERKYDKGGGGGGSERIEDAIKKVTDILNAKPYGTKSPKYKIRLIDVFGFSRGSATARDFVNTFIEFKVKKHTRKYGDVRFNFIGIYDTVGSFGAPGNDVDWKPWHPDVFDEADTDLIDGKADNYLIIDHNRKNKTLTHKELFADKAEAEHRALELESYGMKAVVAPYYPPSPYGAAFTPSGYEVIATIKERDAYTPYNFNLCMQSAHKIVHMTAHDEVRKNFPLTNIQGSGGLETSMLGVHSDVGGGYPPEKMERHRFPYRGHFKGVHAAAQKHAQKLSSLGGVWQVESAHCGRQGRGAYVLLKKVLNDLSNVTLNLMYEQTQKLSGEHAVDFNPMPQDENHAILPSLEGYYVYAKEHLRSAYTYGQTQDGQYLDATQRHHSSADPAGKSTHYVGNTKPLDDAWKKDSADGGGNDARYVDKYGKQVDGRESPRLADHVERAVFPNNSSGAVKPVSA